MATCTMVICAVSSVRTKAVSHDVDLTGSIGHCTLNYQSLILNVYFVLDVFHIKIVFPTYVQFCTKIVVLYIFRDYSAANLFWFPRKFLPHAPQQPDSNYPGRHHATKLNNQRQNQLLQNEVMVFD